MLMHSTKQACWLEWRGHLGKRAARLSLTRSLRPRGKLLEEPLRKSYKSIHAQLRWPVCHVIPEMAYEVSASSQKNRETLTYGDAHDLNDSIQKGKDLASPGKCKLDFVTMQIDNLVVLLPHDASFAKERLSSSILVVFYLMCCKFSTSPVLAILPTAASTFPIMGTR